MMPPHLASVWGKAQKRDNGFCLQFFLEGRGVPPLTLLPDISVPFCMTWVLFKVLPQCWSPEGIRLSKSFWSPPQEEMPENPTVSSADPTPTGFYSQKLWGLIFLALEPWTGWSDVGLRSLVLKISLHFISITHGFGTSPFCFSMCLPPRPRQPHPFYPPGECSFFDSLVVGLPYSSIFWCF